DRLLGLWRREIHEIAEGPTDKSRIPDWRHDEETRIQRVGEVALRFGRLVVDVRIRPGVTQRDRRIQRDRPRQDWPRFGEDRTSLRPRLIADQQRGKNDTEGRPANDRKNTLPGGVTSVSVWHRVGV